MYPPNFKPLNQIGQPLSAVLPSVPKRKQMKQPLYQVWVEDRVKGEIPVGPKWMKQSAERLCEAINRQICTGRERTWSNPRLVEVSAVH